MKNTINIQGKYTKAKVFATNIQEKAISQITDLCNQEYSKGSKIRIMPDVHAGNPAIVGLTMTIEDNVIPDLIGPDIGCGVICCEILNENKINFKHLDELIKLKIAPPSSPFVSESEKILIYSKLRKLKCFNHINFKKAIATYGTLGGGNHFIEIDEDFDDTKYLMIHSGSRNLGGQVFKYYQKLAKQKFKDNKEEKLKIISNLKKIGEEKEIEKVLKSMPLKKPKANCNPLYEQAMKDYLHDMNIVQEFSNDNRMQMAKIIFSNMNWQCGKINSSIHNYIDIEKKILRKGSIAAEKGQPIIIPLNMKDGTILAVGKGNEDWNYSAPHGAGRNYSRSRAKEQLDFNVFKEQMQNIHVNITESIIDEAPNAYKSPEDILDVIKPTATEVYLIKPIYVFKNGDEY